MDKAPLTAKELAALKADAQNIRAAAKRKNTTLDDWDEKRETEAARQHFDLGCWLYYYSRRVYLEGAEGLKYRTDCARRIFLAGLTNPGYSFFTVFDFGERQFDTIFEMGDADQVIDGLRQAAKADQSGHIARAFAYMGWTFELKKFTAFTRIMETEDTMAVLIECEANQKSIVAAIEFELLQEMIRDGLVKEGTSVEVVTERGYDLNGVLEGHHCNVFDRLPFDSNQKEATLCQ